MAKVKSSKSDAEKNRDMDPLIRAIYPKSKGKARRTPPPFLGTLLSALETELSNVGIKAEIDSEPIPGTKLYRLMVLAPKMESLRPSERQDLVWRIATDALRREDRFKISTILTLTPKELSGGWE